MCFVLWLASIRINPSIIIIFYSVWPTESCHGFLLHPIAHVLSQRTAWYSENSTDRTRLRTACKRTRRREFTIHTEHAPRVERNASHNNEIVVYFICLAFHQFIFNDIVCRWCSTNIFFSTFSFLSSCRHQYYKVSVLQTVCSTRNSKNLKLCKTKFAAEKMWFSRRTCLCVYISNIRVNWNVMSIVAKHK